MSGISSGKILTFLSPLFRYFREVSYLTEDYKGKKILLDLVGGAVRDHVINTNPRVQQSLRARGRGHLIGKEIKDLDLSTNASPETVVALVKDLANPQQQAAKASHEKEAKWWSQWAKYKVNYIEGLGEQHGTVTFTFNYDGSGVEDQQIEITTHRTEEYDDEGRKPSRVNFSSEDEGPDKSRRKDSMRRDLSFNAMYMDSTGTITDHHGGIDDLIAGTLSIPAKAGESTYQAAMRVLKEDPLRFLRWIRFSGAYASAPTPEILRALKDLRGSATIVLDDGTKLNIKDLKLLDLIEHRVSGNRKQVEISKIVSHGGYAAGFKMLDDQGVYQHLFPNADTFHVAAPLLAKLEQAGIKGPPVLSVLYTHQPTDHIKKDLGVSPSAGKEEARKSLNFSAQDIKQVSVIQATLQEYSARLSHLSDEGLAKHLLDQLGSLITVTLKILSCLYPQDSKRFQRLPEVVAALGSHVKPDFSGLNYPQINGQEVIKMTGLKGPAIKVILELIREAFRRHELGESQIPDFIQYIGEKIKSGGIEVSKADPQTLQSLYQIVKAGYKPAKLARRVVASYLKRITSSEY